MTPVEASTAMIKVDAVIDSNVVASTWRQWFQGYLRPDLPASQQPPTPNDARSVWIEDARESLVPPVVIPRRPELTRERFTALQTWEGVVTSVSDDSFKAQLRDKTSPGTAPEVVELDLEDVARSDRDLAVDGAIFYWTIGYIDSAGGQRIRSSALRFRRLPAWSAGELEEARKRAHETANLLNWR